MLVGYRLRPMAGEALRCNTRIELTVDEWLFLDRIRDARHAVPARLHCELEHRHHGEHHAFGQAPGTTSYDTLWWMRWSGTGRAAVELAYCLAKDPDWPAEADEDDPMYCGLPRDHAGAHEWQLRSDLEYTRTANGVSELGKDRLRTIPEPTGPLLRIDRDERTLAVRWPDWERWLMIWPPAYPDYAGERRPTAQTEYSRLMQDADFDEPPWVDPAPGGVYHRDLPGLTQAVRDELTRALASVERTLDTIDAKPRRRPPLPWQAIR
jgi:hypothetical protein